MTNADARRKVTAMDRVVTRLAAKLLPLLIVGGA